VAYVLSGEVTFMIGNEVTVGGAGTCLHATRRAACMEECRRGNRAGAVSLHSGQGGRVVGGAPPDWPQLRVDERARGHRDTGVETARVLFLCTPAKVGGLICQRYGWEIVGPPPL
jgi:hypothetical protein